MIEFDAHASATARFRRTHALGDFLAGARRANGDFAQRSSVDCTKVHYRLSPIDGEHLPVYIFGFGTEVIDRTFADEEF